MSVEALGDQSRVHRRVLREVGVAARRSETACLHSKRLVDEGILLVVRVSARSHQLHLQLFVRGGQQTSIRCQVGQTGSRSLHVRGDFRQFARPEPIVRLDSLTQVVIETRVNHRLFVLVKSLAESIMFARASFLVQVHLVFN